jgi:hypothetical protein
MARIRVVLIPKCGSCRIAFILSILMLVVLWTILPHVAAACILRGQVRFRGTLQSQSTLTASPSNWNVYVVGVDEVLTAFQGWPNGGESWPSIGEQAYVFWPTLSVSNTYTAPGLQYHAPQPQVQSIGERVEVYGYLYGCEAALSNLPGSPRQIVELQESYHYLNGLSALGGTTVPTSVTTKPPLLQAAKIAGATIVGGAVSGVVTKIAAAGLARSLGIPAAFAFPPAIVGGVASALTAGVLRNSGVDPTTSALAGVAVGTGFGLATAFALGIALGPPGWIALTLGVAISAFLGVALSG